MTVERGGRKLYRAHACDYCRSVVVPAGLSVDEAVLAKARELADLDWQALQLASG